MLRLYNIYNNFYIKDTEIYVSFLILRSAGLHNINIHSSLSYTQLENDCYDIKQ